MAKTLGEIFKQVYWATLMPIFSPQTKFAGNFYDPHNGLLFYEKVTGRKVVFSDSVLEAMEAEAPAPLPAGSLLKSSLWDGPQIFKEYIIDSATVIGAVPAKKVSPTEAAKLHTEFLMNLGLYIPDPLITSNPTKGGQTLIVPNPDYDLSFEMLSRTYGTSEKDRLDLITKVGADFYQLLLPENYGFSTTLIYPNQALVDGISAQVVPDDEIDTERKRQDEEEERKKKLQEEWDKIYKKKNPYDPGPWKPQPNPWPDPPYVDPRKKPNPYGPYGDDDWTPNKEWYEEQHKRAQRYKEYIKNPSNVDAMTEEEKEEMKKWLKENYSSYGGSSASAANQSYKK